MAGAGGLAAYLGRQRGLVLVFLNGCSTEPQQQMLIDAGVPCVIATSRAISDMAAAQFAIYFYNSLAKGSSITTAFANGTDLSACAAQDTPCNFYPAGIHGDAHADIWPWRSFIRKGSESSVQNWNLPSIAGNPLWGLPGVAIDIPDKPFRGNQGFHRQDARIFFGRKAEIRCPL